MSRLADKWLLWGALLKYLLGLCFRVAAFWIWRLAKVFQMSEEYLEITVHS